MAEVGEEHASLWTLAVPPLVWAVHFLASYLTVAVWCAKLSGEGRALGGARIALASYTAMALAVLALTGARGLRKARHAGARPPHDADTPEDRYRFLGRAALLLSGLSAVAIAYETLVIVFVRSCD
ncbi:MAG: hypothetical protein ABW252_23245 [Polyangiales bacterium]